MHEGIDPWTLIPRGEYVDRQRRLRGLAGERDFDAVLVYSKGGAFMDMCQDVLYLTNHYSQQPYVGDEAGIGSARSHGVCLLPVDGPTSLVVDIPWWRDDLVVADDVIPTIEVTEAVVDRIRATGLDRKRVALVGSSYMSAAAYLGLVDALPQLDLVRADTLLEELRIRKTPSELAVIRRAAALGNRTLETLLDSVVEGATEAEAVGEASRVLLSGGGVLYDAACASGPRASRFTYSRLPSSDASRQFEQGDMFHVDCYGSYAGYFFDFARSRTVGPPTESQKALLEAVIDCVETICAGIRPGVTGGEIQAIGAEWLRGSPFPAWTTEDDPEMESFPAVGHGLGMMWEAPWLVEGDQTVIEPNMYLAIEMLLASDDGAAMFEHNGLVTEDGFEVLTTARERWW